MMSSNPWREGFEDIMFRTANGQPTLWDSILPPELLVLPQELGQVEVLLDDPVFFAPFAEYFDAHRSSWPTSMSMPPRGSTAN